MKKYLPFIVIVTVIVVIAAIALGNKNNENAATPPPAPTSSTNSSSKESTNSGTATPSPQAGEKSSVSIVNMSFSPTSTSIKKGTAVTWTNNDSVAHTVTADTGSAFDSGNLNPGKTFSHTFDTAGTFAYHCTYHSNMHGTVTVTE
jgi:plastocyanin